MSEREGLIARIRQIRRSAAATQSRSSSTIQTSDEMRSLEQRVAHLEQLVEGLQDSVHREVLRHGKRLTELEARVSPGAISRALSKDARDRGL